MGEKILMPSNAGQLAQWFLASLLNVKHTVHINKYEVKQFVIYYRKQQTGESVSMVFLSKYNKGMRQPTHSI